jgi:mannose-6-phosphate isomerase
VFYGQKRLSDYNRAMKAYPLQFRPIYKQRIWGGQKLRDFFGRELPAGEKIGESWELSDLPEDKSVITNGELAGLTLNGAIKKYPKEITGDENFKLPFPLLIKFIDAEDILSIQVHPDEEICKKLGKGEPKTECWYIIDAESGSFIYKGLKKGVTKKQFAEAIDNGTAEHLVQRVYVKAGECHYLPAGTVHTMGPGLIVAEIQTPSDTTYRVFDFNRVDEMGKSRPLHIKEALESIHFENRDELPVTTVGRLVNSKYFKVDKGHQAAGCEMLLSAGIMKVLIITSGKGMIKSGDEDAAEFKAGDCLLVPAGYEGAAVFEKETEYLTVTL